MKITYYVDETSNIMLSEPSYIIVASKNKVIKK